MRLTIAAVERGCRTDPVCISCLRPIHSYFQQVIGHCVDFSLADAREDDSYAKEGQAIALPCKKP